MTSLILKLLTFRRRTGTEFQRDPEIERKMLELLSAG